MNIYTIGELNVKYLKYISRFFFFFIYIGIYNKEYFQNTEEL